MAGHPQTPPLTPEERAHAAKVKVWGLWDEDQFHWGDERDSFPVAICLTEKEAQEEFGRRGREGINKPLTPGWDGIEVLGPWTLLEENPGYVWCGVDVVREVLRRVETGKPGPVAVPIR